MIQDITFGQFASELRRYDVSAKISYGKSGYGIVITDRDGKEYVGFSWDAVEAFDFAMRGIKRRGLEEEITENDLPREMMATLNEIKRK